MTETYLAFFILATFVWALATVFWHGCNDGWGYFRLWFVNVFLQGLYNGAILNTLAALALWALYVVNRL